VPGARSSLTHVWQMIANHRYNPDMILRTSIRYSLVILGLLWGANAASAQLPTANPVPFSGAVPSGTGACSVAKSCAEVAPDIIRKALGPSALEENLHYQGNTIGARGPDSQTEASEITWAIEAFHRAGLENVHSEKFAVPSGSGDKASGEPVNVVAEIRGRELPDEFVLVAGRFGGSEKPSDVTRDGETAALVVDAARAIHASGSIPRRSIRFVLFGGSDQGMLGSQAYVAAHRAELDRMIAAVSMDIGASPVTGFSLEGRRDILTAVQEALAPIRSLGATRFTTDARISNDSFAFLLAGIPTLVPNEEPANSAAVHPAAKGTYDSAAIDALKHQVAIVAVAAYALSDSEGRIGTRQSKSEVDKLLSDTGLARQMKTDGTLAAWEKGQAGGQP